ncbi:hypothetical protein [Polyangium spumosum]|uniref:Uncharacterized protein n=1 Tax=Polyangium spumosum TaxID=889282 RepID=A0A6N7PI60_9BACT|nr:hypothetical protein [Polyangium spumosum]MRG91668.1 hypothetical protein [Polyangium spumosum]
MQGGGNAGGPTCTLDVGGRGFAGTPPPGSTLDTPDGAGELRGEIFPEADAPGPRSTACFGRPAGLTLDARDVEGLLALDGGGELRDEISPEAGAPGPRSTACFGRPPGPALDARALDGRAISVGPRSEVSR